MILSGSAPGHYMQPLSKKPNTVIIHVGTNDANIKGATADKIIDKLLELKKEIENKLPEAAVVISTPLKRNDKVGVGQIIETLNKKIRGLGLSIVDDTNIDSQDLGHKGLHLNARGVGKFATNFINKLRSFQYPDRSASSASWIRKRYDNCIP